VEIDASGYFMGSILMQGGRLISYHSEMFHGDVLRYPIADKELQTLVQVFMKWKNYMMGKETIILTDHEQL
jgi:hypothetical protein